MIDLKELLGNPFVSFCKKHNLTSCDCGCIKSDEFFQVKTKGDLYPSMLEYIEEEVAGGDETYDYFTLWAFAKIKGGYLYRLETDIEDPNYNRNKRWVLFCKNLYVFDTEDDILMGVERGFLEDKGFLYLFEIDA